MKNLIRLSLWFVLGFSLMLAQSPYRTVTIREIQEVPMDSLFRADGLQNSIPSRWKLQTSPFLPATVAERETVEVVCQVVVPWKVINFTGGGFTLLVRDTAADAASWSGVFCRVSGGGDTTAMKNEGFGNVERGDIIRMRGYVDEFPSSSMNSLTQFVPVPGLPITVLGAKPLPPPLKKSISDSYRGLYPGGEVRYSTGEPFEAAYVEFTNLTVNGTWSPGSGRTNLTVVDDDGNMTLTYDASGYFTTLASRQHTTFEGSEVAPYTSPPFGARIDTLRGMLTTVSGSQNAAGYIVAPLLPGDLKVGITRPYVATHRREPVLVAPSDTVRISVKSAKAQGGLDLQSVHLKYSVNNGPWVVDSTQGEKVDSTYQWQISPKAVNSVIRYFVQTYDVQGNQATLASSATGGAGTDTSKGFFFYTVLDRPLTIYDLQWTPYHNGRSAYLGATTTVSGVITADTSGIGISPLNTAGTTAWYLQASNQPWNGLWVVGPESTMATLRAGDSVSITGTVQEQFDVTRLSNTGTPVVIHASGRTPPAPVILTTGVLGPNVANGTPSAEQWEGMLVRFNNVTISNINPIFSDNTEFELDDGSGGILVRRDGKHKYSNVVGDTSLGKTIIYQGDKFSFVQGVIFYSFNRYKIVPRGDSDFGTLITGIVRDDAIIPNSFVLEQNYPNPFNPSTIIRYDLPAAQYVTLKVYNLLGQEVRTLVNDYQMPGRYTVSMDASGLASGVYIYRLTTETASQVRRMVLLK